MEKSIEDHIQKDKKILDDPTISPQQRRHIESELHDLEEYKEHNPDDHHDPTYLEVYCDQNPSEPECLVYEDWISVTRGFTTLFFIEYYC